MYLSRLTGNVDRFSVYFNQDASNAAAYFKYDVAQTGFQLSGSTAFGMGLPLVAFEVANNGMAIYKSILAHYFYALQYTSYILLAWILTCF